MDKAEGDKTAIALGDQFIAFGTGEGRVRAEAGGIPRNLLDQQWLEQRSRGVGPGKVAKGEEEECPKLRLFGKALSDVGLQLNIILRIALQQTLPEPL